MEVFVKDKFYKKICKYPKFVQQHILKSLELLKEFPFARLDIKKLAGTDDLFRLRIGNYRIFFLLEESKIYVFDVEVRKKAYK